MSKHIVLNSCRLALLALCFGPWNTATAATPLSTVSATLQVGDVVFIRVGALPFRKIAETTNSWTNHVGIVVDTTDGQVQVAESRVPRSGTTSLARFIGRSSGGRVEISRLERPLTDAQQQMVRRAAAERAGIFYDTGFNLHSRREFCSRYVREILAEATGVQVGEVQTFATLLQQNSHADLGFWRLWYFGRIPWQRETVTPASILNSPQLHPVFDGYVTTRS